MSKNETMNSTDAFSACQKNMGRLFDGIKQSVPKYHQSATNVQQEYLQAFENIVGTTITLQQECIKKIGIATNIPEPTLKIIYDTTEEFVKAAYLQNQITLATIDAAQQTIRTFSDNAKSFTDLNRNILQSWVSAFTTKN